MRFGSDVVRGVTAYTGPTQGPFVNHDVGSHPADRPRVVGWVAFQTIGRLEESISAPGESRRPRAD